MGNYPSARQREKLFIEREEVKKNKHFRDTEKYIRKENSYKLIHCNTQVN
jgi:hypothetical protein